MAVRVLTDVFFSHNAVDLSAYVTSVRISYSADQVETTSMGDTTHEFIGGLKNASVEVEFNSEEGSSLVQQTLFPDVGVARTLLIRPDNSEGVSATNPNYTISALLVDFPPLGGGVGELSKAVARYAAAGALSRATI